MFNIYRQQQKEITFVTHLFFHERLYPHNIHAYSLFKFAYLKSKNILSTKRDQVDETTTSVIL